MINVRERKFYTNFDVENESSREQKFQGMKLSFPGTKVLGYKSSSYHRGRQYATKQH